MPRLFVNKAFVGGIWTPGTAVIKGASVKRNLDERIGYGVDFAYVVFTGRKLARFTLELTLANKKDFAEHETFHAKMMHTVPRRGPVQQTSNGYDAARALMIWHPLLAPLDITQFIVEEEAQLDWDDYNVARIPYQCCQVKPTPAAAYAKPEAAAAKPPMTPDEVEIQRLRQENSLKRQANEAAGK